MQPTTIDDSGSQNVLSDWTVSFVKHMDIIKKEIVEIKKDSGKVIVTYKNSSKIFFIQPSLFSFTDVLVIPHDKQVCIVCMNSENNIDFTVKNWKQIIEHPLLTMYFVNPKIPGNNKWILRPHIHNKVADMSSLKTGLKSMSDGVEGINTI